MIYVTLDLDLVDDPDYLTLERDHPEWLWWWLRLLQFAGRAGKKGRILKSDGRPVTAAHLAATHHRDASREAEWQAMLDYCVSLDLLTDEPGKGYRITHWSRWWRPPSAAKEATAARKQAQRDRDRQRDTEDGHEGVTRGHEGSRGCHEGSRECHGCHDTDPPQIHHRSRSDPDPPPDPEAEGGGGLSPAVDWTAEVLERLHAVVLKHLTTWATASGGSPPAPEPLRRKLEALQETPYRTVRAAVKGAMDEIRWRLNAGKPVDNPGAYLFAILPGHVAAARADANHKFRPPKAKETPHPSGPYLGSGPAPVRAPAGWRPPGKPEQ